MKQDIIHKSKVGIGILTVLIITLGLVTIFMVIKLICIGIVICGLVTLYSVSIYAGTYYKITEARRLHVQCGIFMSLNIDVNDIESVKATDELTNAPALSGDRLEVRYKQGRVLVSPANKDKFIADLKSLNPKIITTND